MRSLFYGVVLLHLILWVSCTGSSRSREGKESESPAELLSDSDSLTTFDFEGDWHWFAGDNEASVTMKIFSNKDSVGDYLYTYYFGNRIEQGKVKLLSQEGRNAVLLVEYNDQREFHSWSSKFNATMLTDTSFFLTRQKHEDYYLEDSIVMRKYVPYQDTAEVRRLMEEFERRMSSRYKYLKD
ncbi:hypothetical protein [Coprobacter sp.]